MPDALERKYPKAAKESGWQFAFPSSRLSPDRLNGKIRRFYMSPKTIQNAMSEAVKKAKIVKHATVHILVPAEKPIRNLITQILKEITRLNLSV